MPRLLVLDSLFDSLDLEEPVARERGWTTERWKGEADQLASADAVVHVRTTVNRALIEQLRRCRVVGRFGTGLDSVDLEAASSAGVAVVNVLDYCIPELASHTVALALALERRLASTASPAAADREWQDVAHDWPLVGRTTVAVVGVGSVGEAVAAAFVAMGYTVLAVTAQGRDRAARVGASVVPLGQALGTADIVTLHVPLDDRRRGMVDASFLRQAKEDAILVNTARLGLFDESAVAGSLADGRLAGLGLDARLPAASPLRDFLGDERVLVTPHVGWYSERSAAQLRTETIARTIDAFDARCI